MHDIDLAINKISEESNEDANIIWGLQKDDNYNGKFKISVISTGIDSENYYKDIIHKENITKLDNIANSRILSSDDQNSKKEKSQPSFLVDLREPNKFQKRTEDLKEEEKIINEQHPEKNKPKKKTLLGMIFGTNSKDVKKISTESDHEKESSKEQNEVDQNDVNDDLLQIPAFLRRQAN